VLGKPLVFQVTNHLAGGCVSNCFLVSDGSLITPIARGEEAEVGQGQSKGPSIPSPVLPGIVRGFVLEWAARRSHKVTRRMLSISDVLAADEVFLTNTSWGVLPVVRVEKEAIGSGAVGEITTLAREAWLAATGA
jgi:branched-subunit amino acid aminotransferase/4-amino-4-deoxychorismate lyase